MIALSWSRLSSYQQCPLKFHLQFISKSFREEEASIHLIKGKELHKQLEDYIVAKNGGAAMPLGFSPEVRETLPYVDKLFTLYDMVHPEAQVAARQDWSPTEWFGKDVGWRAIWDAACMKSSTLFLPDWKSGKVYALGDGFGQLHLSAVMGLERFKEVPEVNAAYVYIEHKKIVKIKVVREPGEVDDQGKPVPHLAQVREHFEKEFDKVQRETAWDPRPNEFCKYCQATKAQCKFSRKM
jgi:hypothetical protein